MSEFYKSKRRILRNKIIIFLIALIIYFVIIGVVLGKDLKTFLSYTVLYMPLFVFGFVIMSLRDNYYKYIHGEEGEDIVSKELSMLEKLGGCFVYDNICLPNRKGNLDHVVVSRKGIFVIETKNHAGKYKIINKDWFHKDGGFFEKYSKVPNPPINQATGNAVALKEYLTDRIRNPKIFVNPVVVLVNGLDTKNSNPADLVISPEMLKETLYSYGLTQERELLIEVKNELDNLSESSF